MVKSLCLQNILLADDGSDHARAAIQLLQNLPLSPETHITVLRVFSSQQATEAFQLEAAINATCTSLRNKGFQAEPELLMGSPAETIIDYAEKKYPDLILLGAKGLRATLGILLGGVAQQVIEYASCPVLVVRAPFKKLRRFLVAVDASPNSEQALECMTRFPYPERSELCVMHVLPPHYQVIGTQVAYGLPVEQPSIIPEEVSRQRAAEEEEGQLLLKRMSENLSATHLPVETVLRRGDAATEIMEFVKQNQVDLIVAGSRGLSRMRSWLLGSVSRKLVHYSGCSVLIVRGNNG
jgi:nucleotide-binding universal stress UspA family protein